MSLQLTGSYHPLPTEKLSPQDFERLCLWLIRREGYTDVEYLGASGNEQGRDLTARLDNKRIAFQCKRVRSFYPSDATVEIEKLSSLDLSQKPDEIVFIITCAVSVNTRNITRDIWGNSETCHFWAGDELDERIKRHPEILREFFQLTGDISADTSKSRFADSSELTEYLRALIEFCGQSPYSSLIIRPTLSLPTVYVEQKVEKNIRSRDTLSSSEIVGYGNVALQGIPGMGKTSLVYHSAARLAQSLLDSNLAEPGLFPAVVSARTLAAERGSFADSLRAAAGAELGYLLPRRLSESLFDGRPMLKAKWLVFIDGLDEVLSIRERERLMKAIHVQKNYPDSPYIFFVTTRPLADPSLLGDFPALTLLPFEPKTSEEFALRWFTGRSGDPISDAEGFLSRVRQSRIVDLARVPLLLTMAAIVYEKDRASALPTRRSGLYRRFISVLLEDEEALRETRPQFRKEWEARLGAEGGVWADQIFNSRWRIIQHLAVQQQSEPHVDLVREGERFISATSNVTRPINPEWLEQQVGILLLRTGLIVRRSGREEFSHGTFREYAVASALASRLTPDSIDLENDFSGLGGVDESREIILFLLGLWSDSGQDVSSVLNNLAMIGLSGLQTAGAALADNARAKQDSISNVVNRLIEEIPLLKDDFVSTLDPYSPIRLLGNIRADGIVPRLREIADRRDLGSIIRMVVSLALEDQGDKDFSTTLLAQLGSKDTDSGIFSLHHLISTGRGSELLAIARDSNANPVMRMMAAQGSIELGFKDNIVALARDNMMDKDGRKAAMSALGLTNNTNDLLEIATTPLTQDLSLALAEVLEKNWDFDSLKQLIRNPKATGDARKGAGIALHRLGRTEDLRLIARDRSLDKSVAQFIGVLTGIRDRNVILGLGRQSGPNPRGVADPGKKTKRKMEKKSRRNNRRKK